MKYIGICFAALMVLSCSSQKTVPGQNAHGADSLKEVAANNETKAATPTKTIILNYTESGDKRKNATDNKAGSDVANLPACLQKLVKGFLEEEVQNPPRKIYSYTYNGGLVYYVTPPCCDFFSDLYDAQCKLIAHPDGGITGRGDGRAKDFAQTKSNEKLVWEDVRGR